MHLNPKIESEQSLTPTPVQPDVLRRRFTLHVTGQCEPLDR